MILQAYIASLIAFSAKFERAVGFNLTLGENVFVGHMPSSAERGILVANTLPLVKDHYTKLINGRVQMISRASTPQDAELVMRKVSNLLTAWDLKDEKIRVLKILPVNEPYSYPRQDTGGFEASVSFEVTYTYDEDI